MTLGVTHILSIREMIDIYFNTKNGYTAVKVLDGMFYDNLPLNER